jgi:UDP-glucose 4-epimerase
MRVLVTGAAGFIASHIADALLARGDEVVVLDNLSNGRRDCVPSGAVFVKGDVRNPADIDQAFLALDARPIDAVCHLAGQASTFRSFDEPAWDMEVNGVGTARMLEGALRHGAATFLYASSMTVYGSPSRLPVREDAPCNPLSYYGVTKWAAERSVLLAATQGPAEKRLRSCAFRMFNVYGERQSLTNPYQGVLGIFIGNVLRNEPISIFGDGEQSRDFVYVGDVANAWVAALDRSDLNALVFNLGTGTQTSINQLWRMAVSSCDIDPESWDVSYGPERPGDQRHMVADIAAARERLDWMPTTSLEEGVRSTVEWARADSDDAGDS